MNAPIRWRKESATTLLEVLVLVAVMGMTALVILPSTTHCKADASRISCVNNLKNVGLAFRIFATEHGDQLPWQLSGTNGTKDLLADSGLGWKQFAFVSNELSSPKILVCPSDKERSAAQNFTGFGSGNLSYFLGLLADETNPQTILGGDRNLTTNGVAVGPGLLRLGTNQNGGFTRKIHGGDGNLLMADGSVQQVTSWRLQESVVNAAVASTNLINRLLIP